MLSDLTSGVGRQRVLAVVSVLVLIMASFATMGVAEHSQDRDDLDRHCDDHQGHPNKVEDPAPGSAHMVTVNDTEVWLHFSDDLESVEFFADEAGTEPIAVEFCIKAGDRAGGQEAGTGGHVSWENNGGETPQISYVVVYRLADEPPEDECPADLTLTHDDDVNNVGEPHTVTATVTDGDEPCAGIDVRFEVDPPEGADPLATDTATTDADGQATFTYTKHQPSEDTITACTDADGDAPELCDTDDHVFDTIDKTWIEPPEVAHWTCRASLLRIQDGPILNEILGDPFEPIVANEDGDECAAEANEPLNEILDEILGATGLDDFADISLLSAVTEHSPGVSVSSRAEVVDVTLTDGENFIRVGVLTAESTGTCDADGNPQLDGGSEVVSLSFGFMGDEEEIELPPDHEYTPIDLQELGTIHLNYEELDENGDEGRITHRAFWLEGNPVLGDVIIAESIADYHGNPCAN